MKKQLLFLSLLSSLVLGSCVSPVAKSSVEGGETSTEESTSSIALSSITAPDSLDPEAQPEGDIHSELQYKYLCDEWTSIKTYVPKTNASGQNPGNLSSPRGLILDFEDAEDADTYYIEISKNAN
ncbi:MAG: hypothetical protein IKN69_03630, partial [Bacilli bacterium]|nr:hypothetical protein [Bacilli bacterium]